MIAITKLKNMSEKLQMIADDAETDSKNMDGKPFTGKVVAQNMGYIRAQINALALQMKVLVDDQLGEQISKETDL